MSKFNLKKARELAAKATTEAAPIGDGYHRVVIVQVAETGAQTAYNPEEDPVQSCGITFENAAGQQVVKTMPLKMSVFSNFQKMLKALDDIGEMEDLLGKELDIEIEANGKYPKVLGLYHVDDGMSGQPKITNHSTPIFYSVEEHDPAVAKTLHPQIKAAIASRIRMKV
ncbi:MAG: hypothetical protein AB8F34_05420 [Akkermansiaceae bacterium]